MRPRSSKVAARLLALVLVLATPLFWQPARAFPASAQSPQSTGPTVDPRNKIHPNLLAEIGALAPGSFRAAAAHSITFVARIVAGADLSPYATSWFARPYVDPTGTTVAHGVASPAGILKLATLDRVLYLQRPESLIEPPRPIDTEEQTSLNNQAQFRLNPSPSAGPDPDPNGWYDVGQAIHGSRQAWEKGYTGEGVRLMINDSGADYCHPDLRKTYAYVEDPQSPYYGLPQMFDSISSYIAAIDFYTGTSLVSEGLTDYADTSTEISADNASYQPLGAATAHSYILPDTSKSGVYHIGSHPDNSLAMLAPLLSAAFGDGTAVEGERAAVLVVDKKQAGVYDHVYVDLNYNFNFTDDEPAILDRKFKYHETACLDYNGDRLEDISGGLVYFVSDGITAVPTLDWFWGIPGETFGPGDLVAFHVLDFVASPGGNHGMGCTSVAVGQGRVRGSVFWGPEGPPQARGRGLVKGPGRDAKTTQNGDFYSSIFVEDGFIFASVGYDGQPGTGDEAQIMSNSWGSSDIDNDGWDRESRQLDLINRVLGPSTAFLFSGGNGAAGYGTIAQPAPPSGIEVGASTLFDDIGIFEPIASRRQIVGGDPMSWSARGPGADVNHGPDVLATGAFGVGGIGLNEVGDGAVATAIFGGTSMASPVAAGNLALIAQAWRDRTGVWPTFAELKELLMGSARDTHHDVLTQGAGLVNADEGTDLAGGHEGAYATPSEWQPGDYRGTDYEAFAKVLRPGNSDTQTFTLHNPSPKPVRVTLDARTFKLIGTRDYSFTSQDQSLDHGQSTVPDYVVRIDQDIPRGTDLLQVRQSYAYEQFNPTDDLSLPFDQYNNWRLHILNWRDRDHDRQFWEDANGNGKVDVVLDDTGNLVGSEMDAQETIRFTYGDNYGPTQEARVGLPLERMDKGILLGFRHINRTDAVPTTTLGVEASFWDQAGWEWLRLDRTTVTVPAGGTATFTATMNIPRRTPYGVYDGAIMAWYDDDRDEEAVVIPVTVAVAARGTSFSIGAADPPSERRLYNNAAIFGYTDYNWRQEGGDWRFFYTDIHDSDLPDNGTPYLLVDNRWSGDASDIDTIVLGPQRDCFSNGVDCPFPFPDFPGFQPLYGPYTLEPVGGSPNTYVGSGRWLYQTSSAGPRDLIAAPAQIGLHGILLHHVRVDGAALNEPFGAQVGLASVSTAIDGASGTAAITIASEIALDDFQGGAFGLSQPVTTAETAQQDDPNDPTTASVVRTIDLSHAGELTVSTASDSAGLDIDLFVLGPDGALLGASTTPEAAETVTVVLPPDGTYTILVHGWSVPGGSAPFELTIDAIQGNDITVTALPDAIPAGGSGTMTASWDAASLAPGTYKGLIILGPSYAPALFRVPLEVTVP